MEQCVVVVIIIMTIIIIIILLLISMDDGDIDDGGCNAGCRTCTCTRTRTRTCTRTRPRPRRAALAPACEWGKSGDDLRWRVDVDKQGDRLWPGCQSGFKNGLVAPGRGPCQTSGILQLHNRTRLATGTGRRVASCNKLTRHTRSLTARAKAGARKR